MSTKRKFEYDWHDAKTISAEQFREIIPRKLYKYRATGTNLDKILDKCSLWYAAPQSFNDPFDCQLSVNIGSTKAEIVENMKNNRSLIDLEDEEMRETVYKMIEDDPVFFNDFMSKLHQVYVNESIAVCCFVESWDNILMWAHYTQSHTGVCLEFSVNEGSDIYKNLLPVQYSETYPFFDLAKYKDEQSPFRTMHMQAVATKSLMWEYENEWRDIRNDGENAYPFNPADLSGVTFGINTSDEDKEKTLRLLKENNYPEVAIYQATRDDTLYGINREQIDLVKN